MPTIKELTNDLIFDAALSICYRYTHLCACDSAQFETMDDLINSLGTESEADIHNAQLLECTNEQMELLGWRGTAFTPSGNQSEKNTLEFFMYCDDGELLISGFKEPDRVIVYKIISDDYGNTISKEQLRYMEIK